MFYISSTEDLGISHGVRKKIYAQSKVFAKYFKAKVKIIQNRNGVVSLATIDESGNVNREIALFRMRSKIAKILYYRKLLQLIEKLTHEDSSDNKIVYTRCTFHSKHLADLLKKLKSLGYLIVIEIPSPALPKEFKKTTLSGLYKSLTFNLYKDAIYKTADIIVSIGELSPAFKKFEEKVLVIGNGIDLSDLPIIPPHPFQKSINLIGVATVSNYQGYDRVIKGLAEYYHKFNRCENIPVYFHIVGNGPALPKLKKLVSKLNMKDYIKFHGQRSGKGIEQVFSTAHIGIGPLGCHRKSTSNSSALKSREYCARGIPFILSCDDPDFPESFPFILKVPPNDHPVEITDVVSFYRNIRYKYPNYHQIMRKYAEKKLSWESKLEPVIKKICSIK